MHGSMEAGGGTALDCMDCLWASTRWGHSVPLLPLAPPTCFRPRSCLQVALRVLYLNPVDHKLVGACNQPSKTTQAELGGWGSHRLGHVCCSSRIKAVSHWRS